MLMVVQSYDRTDIFGIRNDKTNKQINKQTKTRKRTETGTKKDRNKHIKIKIGMRIHILTNG